MEEYKKMWRNYVNFSGRSTVRDYWMAALVNFVIGFVIGFVSGAIKFPLLSGLYSLAIIIPSWAVMVRRLHDTNKSGWFCLISLIPVVGSIILIVVLASNSVNEGNRYGDIVE